MRSHLDFNIGAGAEVAMRTIEAALEVKEEFKDFLLLQFFPIYPYFPYSDKVLELFEETLRMGVDGIGGAPHLSSTPEENIDLIFKMAARYDKPIDLHSDESDDPQIQTVSIIADQTVKYGFQGRVTVGHLCSLSAIEQVRANVLIRKIADARLNVVTLPAANMYLQGRNDQGLIRRGTTRINELLEAGVSLASASDNIQDPFHPYGRGDMVQIGLLTAYVAHLGSEADMRNLLQMITATPAGILGHLQYEVQVGNPVKFVIIDAQTIDELFTEQPVGRWVYSNAQWIHGSFQTSSWGADRLNQLWKLVENNPYTC
jgi:cytosine deaminase